MLILSMVNLSLTKADSNDAENDGAIYFGYGDSVISGNSCSDEDMGEGMGSGGYNCFNCSFVTRMRVLYDTSNTSDHTNQPCGGNKVSFPSGNAWQPADVRYFYKWDNWTNTYFIVMLGTNDVRQWASGNGDYTIRKCITGLMRIYNETMENATEPVILIPMAIGESPANGYWKAYFTSLTNAFKNVSVRTVPMWDCTDQDKYNGVMDNYDSALFRTDKLHPNREGHNESAWWLWYWIQGWDYNTTYDGRNNILTVDADYNQTIFINASDWDNSTIMVNYTSNMTAVSYTLQDDYYGQEVIRFDVLKGEQYNISDANSTNFIYGDFTDICGLSNESGIEIYNGTIWGNISVPTLNDLGISGVTISNVEYYKVRIANTSSFTSPFINESNLNQFFNITETNEYYGVHYYQAGYRVKVVTD